MSAFFWNFQRGPKRMAEYHEIETITNTGSIILGILEVRVAAESCKMMRTWTWNSAKIPAPSLQREARRATFCHSFRVQVHRKNVGLKLSW